MLWISCLPPGGAGSRGADSVEPLRRKRQEGAAERDHSTPKAADVKANYCGECVNTVSDGAFAKITSSMMIPAGRKTIAAVSTNVTKDRTPAGYFSF